MHPTLKAKNVFQFFKELLQYFDYAFFIRFILLLIGLRVFNYCYRGLTDETGVVHIAFLGNYLNYVTALKWLLLHTTQWVVGFLDIETTVIGLRKLAIPARPSLILGMPCVGLGMLFFWAAFIGAHKMPWKEKLLWVAGGITAICLINCLRISLMVIALQERWNFNRFMNHHDLFKYIAYLFIALMMWSFYRQYTTTEKVRPASTS